MKTNFYVLSVVIFALCSPPVALAAPITQSFPFAFRDNEGASPVFTGEGDNFTIGVALVIPNVNNGTTATIKHLSTGDSTPIINGASQGRPGLFGTDIPFSTAQANGWLSPWEFTLNNGLDSTTIVTPDRTGVQKMEFVDNLAISGSATSPLVTWELPTLGPTVTRVSYELWNNDTDEILSGESQVNLGAGAVSIELSGLTEGVNYAVRIVASERDATSTITRSSNWMGWTATSGNADGTVLNLTTGSPAGASQFVNTPTSAFNLEFDYLFTSLTGELDVFLDGTNIGTTLLAPSILDIDFSHAVFEVENPLLLGLTVSELLFELDGLIGSNVLIDNIMFPGLLNGDFSAGLNNWSAQGPGSVTVAQAQVPEPSIVALFAAGLFGIGVARRRMRS